MSLGNKNSNKTAFQLPSHDSFDYSVEVSTVAVSNVDRRSVAHTPDLGFYSDVPHPSYLPRYRVIKHTQPEMKRMKYDWPTATWNERRRLFEIVICYINSSLEI